MKKLVFILAVSMLLLSGCSGNEQQAKDAENATANSATNNAQTGNSEDAFSQLLGIGSQGNEYKVKYELKNSAMPEGSESFYTMYAKGDRRRMDIDMGEVKIRTWVLPETAVVCTKMMESIPESCVEMQDYTTDRPELEPLDIAELRENKANYKVELLAQRKIAGESATCFAITVMNIADDVEQEYCLSGDGIMLYNKMGFASQQGTEIKAVSLGRSIQDSEMQPPELDSGDMGGYPEGFNPEEFDPSNFQ